MATKKKAPKAMAKKAMKKTKGGAANVFLKLGGSQNAALPEESLAINYSKIQY